MPDNELNFPCTGCGICCTKVGHSMRIARDMVIMNKGKVTGNVKEIATFPHQIKPDGSCEHLLPDHSCAIYATRPDICNVGKTWEKHFSENIPKKKYFIETAEICNNFIVQAALSDNYIIDTKLLNHAQQTAIP